MKLALLGGGGFRVPLVYGALLGDRHERRVDEVALFDTDAGRLASMGQVLTQMAAERGTGADQLEPPGITVTTDLDQALEGADVVFSAIRVGGLVGRTCDERVALDHGLLGQETTGPGGLAYGLRTLPVAEFIAERVAAVAPQAWFINFTNPAGMITQAMQGVLGDRVIGICDSPIGLGRRAAAAVGVPWSRCEVDYVGLNHLGWLRGLRHDGQDLMPTLLASPAALRTTEEGRLFGPEWVQSIGALPNEYLYYYYYTRDAIAAIRGATRTRGEYLLEQQQRFYDDVRARPREAWSLWRAACADREATYMAETRGNQESRDESDLGSGGYEGVALAIMAAISRGEPATLILNVRNAGSVPGLPEDAVVETVCTVNADGPTPVPASPLTGHMLGLATQVKSVEELLIAAVRERSRDRAVAAFALHPLVDSVNVARDLLRAYERRIPEVGAVFGGTG
ncbi:MAG: 6-phospho-beta-glucosidase [Austwickia sp.]|jgi:6-phospho-beta-glucosidase|nr:6-phospho-beta-glucosidase [Austwickia sp.]MBK8437311.1 6-phospho-beta-glucosidase [Austwickia sp.]MBK9102552.1 6-phospho-beta-glucosidase [Austwickia sp.]